MIEASVRVNGEMVMRRIYREPGLTLEAVAQRMQAYIEDEALNHESDCELRVRFLTLKKAA